ncbi:protein CASC1, partial [Austrofundulus limnaeus]|uniref:Dynein axonemal intermediate chain 7 n=1 Tax=Austrofundulus limnaeus TaxID=52670 RepID=A0A2I4AM24_AUSLI
MQWRGSEVENLQLKALELREDELNEVRHLLEERRAAATQWERGAVEAAKWERYLSCDDVIDSAEQRQVNTFITLWRDEPELNVRKVLTRCHVALQLVDELDVLIKESTDPKQTLVYQEGLVHLQELIQAKLNLTCEDIFKSASSSLKGNP